MPLRTATAALTAVLLASSLLTSCGALPEAPPEPGQPITVAASANLSGVMEKIVEQFTSEYGIEVVVTYGSTTALTQQIENGAPFDVFASADTQHIDRLIDGGWVEEESRAIYGIGRVVAWHPERDTLVLERLEDLALPEVRYVAIANPALAPYGAAAVELLQNAGLWDAVEPKLVYGNSVRQAMQLAETGNADAALIAASLVFSGFVEDLNQVFYRQHVFGGDDFDDFNDTKGSSASLHAPIEQALGVVSEGPNPTGGRLFALYMQGPEGRALLERSGYILPPRPDW